MSLSLSYNDDRSRVQIAVTDLPFQTGTIRIERSENELYWETVRGADALAVEGAAAAVDDYEFIADTENFYRVVPIDPVPGLYLPGEAGSYASTPDQASLRITGDIDLRVDAALNIWDGFGQVLVAKSDHTTDNRAYALMEDGGAGPFADLTISTDGSNTSGDSSSVELPVENGDRLAFRGTRASASGDVAYSTAPSGVDGPWTVLGDTVSSTPGLIFAGTAPLEVGSWADGAFFNAEGTIFAAQVRDGIDGAIVANPDFTNQTMGASSFTDDAGLVWTIHGDAYIVGTETASITPSLGGRIWLKNPRFTFLNRPVTVTDYTPVARSSRSTLHQVQGRSMPVAVTDVRAGAEFSIEIMTETAEEERDIGLSLAAGNIFFVHVPAGCPVPGGYVDIGNISPQRRSQRGKRRYTNLPCTIVAPPGPGVVGGTMTYGALLGLYGGYQNLLAANATYADLLDLMASPDDLVVL